MSWLKRLFKRRDNENNSSGFSDSDSSSSFWESLPIFTWFTGNDSSHSDSGDGFSGWFDSSDSGGFDSGGADSYSDD